jgi:hypothetical protein
LRGAGVAIGDQDLFERMAQQLRVLGPEKDRRVDPLVRDFENHSDRHAIRAERPAEPVHPGELLVIGAVEEELHDDRRVAAAPPPGHEAPDVLEHAVERFRLDLQHPVIVSRVGGIEREDDLARRPPHQAVRDRGREERAVGREVVDHDAARRQVVEDLDDLTMHQGVAAARKTNRFQAAFGELVHQRPDVLERDLLFRPHVHLVAEIAGDVAAIRDVELRVDRPPGRLPRRDPGDDLAFALLRDLVPAMAAPDCRNGLGCRPHNLTRSSAAAPTSRLSEE